MLPSGITFRRATLDDLESLRGLWQESRLPDYELEKRFTEFQVAVDAQDWIVGALGLRTAGRHGQVHSFAVRREDREDELARALWERMLALAQQQNLHRVWTRESRLDWIALGFVVAEARDLNALPATFGPADETKWLVRRLRDDPLKMIAAEEQLEAFLELEHLRTERLVRRSRMLKTLATAFAALLFGLALFGLFLVLRRKPAPRKR